MRKIVPVLAAAAAGYFYAMYRSGRSGLHPMSQAKEGQCKVACVGDSITYGHGTTSWPNHTYPAQLRKLLGKGYHVNNFGFNGKTVTPNSADAYVATKVFTQSTQYKADVLVFMMGTNDSKPRNWHGEEAFRKDLKTLLNCYSDSRWILCTPATAFYKEGVSGNLAEYEIQPEIVDTIADIIRQEAAQRGCTLVDIHALTADRRQWYIADRIHPSNVGAQAIALAVAEAIQGSEQL